MRRSSKPGMTIKDWIPIRWTEQYKSGCIWILFTNTHRIIIINSMGIQLNKNSSFSSSCGPWVSSAGPAASLADLIDLLGQRQ